MSISWAKNRSNSIDSLNVPYHASKRKSWRFLSRVFIPSFQYLPIFALRDRCELIRSDRTTRFLTRAECSRESKDSTVGVVLPAPRVNSTSSPVDTSRCFVNRDPCVFARAASVPTTIPPRGTRTERRGSRTNRFLFRFPRGIEQLGQIGLPVERNDRSDYIIV